MCGRYLTDIDIEEMKAIIEEVKQKFGEDAVRTGEIFPTNQAPVFVAENGLLQTTLMKWGFPQYKGNGVIINARAEAAPEKHTFKTALESRRCVIPTTGFYEWAKDPESQKKDKYLFNLQESPMLYIAGIYNIFPGDLSRFVVLTTAANESMKEVHDRMPVVLGENELGLWINEPSCIMNILHRTPSELQKKKVG